MTALSCTVHSPHWHCGWNSTSSGQHGLFPQLLLKSLFFFQMSNKIPFTSFSDHLLVVIFLFSGHLGRNVDIVKRYNYPVHGNNQVTEVPIICIEIEATVLPTKGEPGPEEMSFILKSHKKSLLFWHWYSTERYFAQSSAQWGFCYCGRHQQACSLCRKCEHLGWGLRDECFHCSLQDDLETVQRLSCVARFQEKFHKIKYNSIWHNFQAPALCSPKWNHF